MTLQKEEEKKNEDSSDSEEEEVDIDGLLGDGGSKQYVSIKPSNEVSLMQKWLLENENT
jgi:hypothetical protein